jgi:LPXTG-motif cell wall-anchored protein
MSEDNIDKKSKTSYMKYLWLLIIGVIILIAIIFFVIKKKKNIINTETAKDIVNVIKTKFDN